MSEPADYFLSTARLGFRHWHEDDLQTAALLWGDREVTRYIDSRGQLSTDQIRARLEEELDIFERHDVQYWPIFHLVNGDLIGSCGLRPYDLANDVYEIGFHIRSNYWGQGYASEAARAVIDWAFDVLGARGLFAGHHPGNQPSRHLLLKLGFRYTHDEPYEATGLDHPSYYLDAGAGDDE